MHGKESSVQHQSTKVLHQFFLPTIHPSDFILFVKIGLCCHLEADKTTATPAQLSFRLTRPVFLESRHTSCPSAVPRCSRAARSGNSDGLMKCYCSEKCEQIKHASNHIRQFTNQSGKPVGAAVGSLRPDCLCDLPAWKLMTVAEVVAASVVCLPRVDTQTRRHTGPTVCLRPQKNI